MRDRHPFPRSRTYCEHQLFFEVAYYFTYNTWKTQKLRETLEVLMIT